MIAASWACAGSIVYVDDDAPAGGDGQTWKTAFRFLQDGLAFAANPANGVTEVRVAQGVYKPDRSEAVPAGTGDRAATFQLNNGVALRGGYRGLNQERLDPDERNIDVFETVLSGDLAGNDAPDAITQAATENSLHVVTSLGHDPSAAIEGFTITRGNATLETERQGSAPSGGGGGVFAFNSHPTITQCRFEWNYAELYGGGVLLHGQGKSSLVLIQCVFVNNQSGFEGGGGSVGCDHVQISNCTFERNTAATFGGGLTVTGCTSAAVVENSRFFGNTAIDGSAVLTNGYTDMRQCVFSGNLGEGGTISSYRFGNALLRLFNCTIQSEQEAIVNAFFGLWNCVVCAADVNPVEAQFIFNSLVPKKYETKFQVGAIHGDPKFVDIDGADGILGNEDDDLRLRAGSPCIDSGDSSAVPVDVTTDLNGLPRFVDDPDTVDTGVGPPPIVDMGAFEYQPGCDADVTPLLTGNGAIDIDDLLFIIGHWDWVGTPGTNAADITGNGVVDIDDLLEVIGAWGPCG